MIQTWRNGEDAPPLWRVRAVGPGVYTVRRREVEPFWRQIAREEFLAAKMRRSRK